MHQRKYFNSNFFINEIFSVEKFPNYGIAIQVDWVYCSQCELPKFSTTNCKFHVSYMVAAM